MTVKKTGFGIVGLGNIAATHANAILGMENAQLIAGSSRSHSSRETFADSFNVPCFSSYDEFLSTENLDVVTICTPSGTHLDFGIKAAEAGKHVIVEKPIEVSVKRGRELIDCCKKNGVKLAVIYQSRFIDGVLEMKKALDDGKIGKPVMARASVKWFRDQEYYTGSGWRGTLDMDGGGAVINQAIHTVDLFLWLLGDVKKISGFKATLTHPGIEAEDNALAAMQFESGALGVFEASTSIVPAQPRYIEINGEKGTLLLEGDEFRFLDADTKETSDKKTGGTGADDPLAGMTSNDHQRQYEQILDAILNDGEPAVSGEESLRSLAFVEALYNSSNRNEVIETGNM
jgi:UDP-N-acetyl-2-amino-2-deoxyglucuronate dehydrogenase